MYKKLILAFIISIGSLSGMTRKSNEAPSYKNDGRWHGPGWYEGTYIGDENTYWKRQDGTNPNGGHEGGDTGGGAHDGGNNGGGHGGGHGGR